MATAVRPTTPRAPRAPRVANARPAAAAANSAPETVASSDPLGGFPDPTQDRALGLLLNSHHPDYLAGIAEWLTAERRRFGGAPALSELRRFADESDVDFAERKANASWVNFLEMMADANTGHLVRQMGTPNYGTMGTVRERADRTDTPTLAELTDDNVTGIGADGQSFETFAAQQIKAIHASPYRWLYAEMPSLASVRAVQGRTTAGAPTIADVAMGLRSYAVSWAPQDVTNWHHQDGRNEWMIVRPPVRQPVMTSEGLAGHDYLRGYLLLVRAGCTALGDAFTAGGWWRFNPDMSPTGERGDWRNTYGEIPVSLLIYERTEGLHAAPQGVPASVLGWNANEIGNAAGVGGRVINQYGTNGGGHASGQDELYQRARPWRIVHYPAMARSPGIELSNISVSLMNAISERDANARRAAVSYSTVAGVDPNTNDADGNPKPNNHNDYVASVASGSVLAPLPYSLAEVSRTAQGEIVRQVVVPTVTPSAMGAVDSAVYERIIDSKFKEAKEVMARELIAAPHSSGASKQAGFIEGKSPRLALLAANAEGAFTRLIRWMELRNGATVPKGYLVLSRDYDLAPVIDTIDRALLRLKDSGLTSKTAMVELVMQAFHQDDLFESNDQAEVIEAELLASAEQAPADTAGIDRALGGVIAADNGPTDHGSTVNASTDPMTADHASGALADALARPVGTPAPRLTPRRTTPPAVVADGSAPNMVADPAAETADDAADAQQIADATVSAILAALAPRLAALEAKVAALDTTPAPTPPPSQIVAVESARPRVGAITFTRNSAGQLTGITLPPASE